MRMALSIGGQGTAGISEARVRVHVGAVDIRGAAAGGAEVAVAAVRRHRAAGGKGRTRGIKLRRWVAVRERGWVRQLKNGGRARAAWGLKVRRLVGRVDGGGGMGTALVGVAWGDKEGCSGGAKDGLGVEGGGRVAVGGWTVVHRNIVDGEVDELFPVVGERLDRGEGSRF